MNDNSSLSNLGNTNINYNTRSLLSYLKNQISNKVTKLGKKIEAETTDQIIKDKDD